MSSECISLDDALAEVAAIRAAIASGEKSVTIAGRSVEYYDFGDRLGYLDRLCRDMQRANGRPSTRTAAWGGNK